MTLDEAVALVSKWQGLLNLQHWRIRVSAFKDKKAIGHIKWNRHYRTAYMRLDLAEVDELHIVHEVCHLFGCHFMDVADDEFQPDSMLYKRFSAAWETTTDELASVAWGLTRESVSDG